MPIKRVTPKAAVAQSINRRVDRLFQVMVNNLCYVGESCIRLARDPNRKRYKDRTGNLTSSIGYVVLFDGKVIRQSDFRPIRGKDRRAAKKQAGGLGIAGSKRGREFLKKLIAENSQGLVLIVVAGMPYAAYVEAMGLDVLESAEIHAQELINRIMKKLRF